MSEQKIEAFEYFVLRLIQWWAEQNPDTEFEENHLSVLKVLMLLFFTCSANHNEFPRIEDKESMFDVFDNFYAMPYGHIEKDVYEHIRANDGKFSFFTIGNRITLTDYPAGQLTSPL